MTTTTGPRTISRAATRQIAELRERLNHCHVYTLDRYFIAAPVDPRHAWTALERHGAKLRDNGNGSYTVSVHSNHWYELTEDAAAKDPARHCFREDNCPHHPDHDGPECCCCGVLAGEHSGCDCEDDQETAR